MQKDGYDHRQRSKPEGGDKNQRDDQLRNGAEESQKSAHPVIHRSGRRIAGSQKGAGESDDQSEERTEKGDLEGDQRLVQGLIHHGEIEGPQLPQKIDGIGQVPDISEV